MQRSVRTENRFLSVPSRNTRQRVAESICRHLGLGRAQADRLLQYLAEFGPNYFQLTHLVPVSARTYRAIAHAVREDGILHGGMRVELTPENAGLVRRAIDHLTALKRTLRQ